MSVRQWFLGIMVGNYGLWGMMGKYGQWLSASWISKQMKYNNCKTFKHVRSMWHNHNDTATCSAIF